MKDTFAVLACVLLCASAQAQDQSDAAIRRQQYLQWRMLGEQDEFGRIPLDARIRATEQRKALLKGRRPLPGIESPEVAPEAAEPAIAGIAPQRWSALGPGNIGGRVRSLLVHPTNPQKIWVGAASGGIWSSSDAGASWRPVDDNLPSLAIRSLAMDPTNSNVMYAGTGECEYPNLTGDVARGVGIYKSADGGATWNRLAATSPAVDTNWMCVNYIAVHPTNGNIVLSANNAGVYRSTNGGASWTRVYSGIAIDVHFNPADGNRAVVGTYAGSVLVSTNAGASWSEMRLSTSGGRVETAYAPSNPSVLYAAVVGGGNGFYKSTNGGTSWAFVSSNANMPWNWNNMLWVSPTDPNLVVYSAIALYRSTDRAATFTQISGAFPPQGPHADMHAVVNDPRYNGTTNKRVYVTTDGGVYATNDITTANAGFYMPDNGWINLNKWDPLESTCRHASLSIL